MNRLYLGLDRDVYLCAAYLSHEQSCYIDHSDSDIIDKLKNEKERFSRNGYVMLMGNLNARCGNLNKLILTLQKTMIAD